LLWLPTNWNISQSNLTVILYKEKLFYHKVIMSLIIYLIFIWDEVKLSEIIDLFIKEWSNFNNKDYVMIHLKKNRY